MKLLVIFGLFLYFHSGLGQFPSTPGGGGPFSPGVAVDPPGPPSGSCPAGWITGTGRDVDGSAVCFKVINGAKTFFEAYTACSQEKAYLAPMYYLQFVPQELISPSAFTIMWANALKIPLFGWIVLFPAGGGVKMNTLMPTGKMQIISAGKDYDGALYITHPDYINKLIPLHAGLREAQGLQFKAVCKKTTKQFGMVQPVMYKQASSFLLRTENDNCSDSYEQCGEWANQGECLTNIIWMQGHCPQACNAC